MKIELGTVSRGTLRAKDLVEAFAYRLAEILAAEDAPDPDHVDLVNAADGDLTFEEADQLTGDLIDALNEYAPDYVYFGAHQGDGSDFGFWVDHEALLSEVPADWSDLVAIVNDH